MACPYPMHFARQYPNPSIRYTISNQTKQRIDYLYVKLSPMILLFLLTDTVRVIPGMREGLLTIQSQHSSFKPYQRLVIQTDQQQYQTSVLTLDDNCAAYSIQITRTGLLTSGRLLLSSSSLGHRNCNCLSVHLCHQRGSFAANIDTVYQQGLRAIQHSEWNLCSLLLSSEPLFIRSSSPSGSRLSQKSIILFF